MRSIIVILAALLMTLRFACAQPASGPAGASKETIDIDVSTPEQIEKAEEGRFGDNVKRCVKGASLPKGVFYIRFTGKDGGFTAAMDVVPPPENPERKRDMDALLQRLGQCDPLFLNSGKAQKRYVRFAGGVESDVDKAIRDHFRKCVAKREAGPSLHVQFSFNRDGTYAERPVLLAPLTDADYIKTATALRDDLAKCPPAQLPAEKYEQWQIFQWSFERDRTFDLEKIQRLLDERSPGNSAKK